MSADLNIKTIQELYEAFGRGDVDAILAALTDDVDWAADTASSVAPWYGVRHGKAAVASFFQSFGSTMEVDEFTPFAFAGNGTEVHTVVRFGGKSRRNGRALSMNLHHYFVLQDGKVSYYRGSEDTALTEAALA